MKHIFHIHEYLRFAMNKDATYWKSNAELDNAIHQAQLSLFMERVGNPAKYQVGHPIPPVSYQVTKKVSADLQPFLREAELELNEDGELTLPPDFVYPTSFRVTVQGSDIDVLDDDKVAKRFKSLIKPVTEEYPIAEILPDGYRVYPNTLTTAYLKYLSLPVKPVYATEIQDDDEVYDDDASTDIQWPPITHNEIVNRALKILGVNVKDVAVTNYANYQTNQGS